MCQNSPFLGRSTALPWNRKIKCVVTTDLPDVSRAWIGLRHQHQVYCSLNKTCTQNLNHEWHFSPLMVLKMMCWFYLAQPRTIIIVFMSDAIPSQLTAWNTVRPSEKTSALGSWEKFCSKKKQKSISTLSPSTITYILQDLSGQVPAVSFLNVGVRGRCHMSHVT